MVFNIQSFVVGRQSGGGGGDIALISLTANENKTYIPPAGKAYNRVSVSVPLPKLETKLILSNGVYLPSADFSGFDKVEVRTIGATIVDWEEDTV